MQKSWLKFVLVLVLLGLVLGAPLLFPVQASNPPQVPTIALPTVTGTPVGIVAIVNQDQDQINVRAGPGTIYPKIGVLFAGQAVPARGRSVGKEWILVDYPGVPGGQAWVFDGLVTLNPNGDLPIVEPPPTPTPLYTATIDPTLAAEFIVTVMPTRLPTFTPPPPLNLPTLPVDAAAGTSGGIPMGFVIVGLGALGVLLGVASFLRGK